MLLYVPYGTWWDISGSRRLFFFRRSVAEGSMLSSSWATGTALFAAVVLFAASARSQCVPYNSSNTAGYPEQMTFASPVYFACPDDLFLVTIEASYESTTPAIQVLTWT